MCGRRPPGQAGRRQRPATAAVGGGCQRRPSVVYDWNELSPQIPYEDGWTWLDHSGSRPVSLHLPVRETVPLCERERGGPLPRVVYSLRLLVFPCADIIFIVLECRIVGRGPGRRRRVPGAALDAASLAPDPIAGSGARPTDPGRHPRPPAIYTVCFQWSETRTHTRPAHTWERHPHTYGSDTCTHGSETRTHTGARPARTRERRSHTHGSDTSTRKGATPAHAREQCPHIHGSNARTHTKSRPAHTWERHQHTRERHLHTRERHQHTHGSETRTHMGVIPAHRREHVWGDTRTHTGARPAHTGATPTYTRKRHPHKHGSDTRTHTGATHGSETGS